MAIPKTDADAVTMPVILMVMGFALIFGAEQAYQPYAGYIGVILLIVGSYLLGARPRSG